MAFNINPDQVLNTSIDGAAAITTHACTSTEGLIAWVITLSIWILLLFLILSTDEKKWAVGTASFVGFIFSIGFLIFGCGAEGLFIFMLVLSILGLAGGFVA